MSHLTYAGSTPATATPGIAQLKASHRVVWAAGDYPAVAEAFVRDVARATVAAAAIEPGTQVLDVAAGSGNASIPAAQAGAHVTALDLVPELLDTGRELARRAGVHIDWVEGDAEALPFADASFDTVLSVVGVQFTPRHEATASEIVRVLRPGGRFALACWTPAGFIGQMFATMKPYLPAPPAGASPPPKYGDEEHVRGLFAHADVELAFASGTARFYAHSPAGFVAFMADHYGPVLKARERLAAEGRWSALEADLIALCERVNTAADGLALATQYQITTGRKGG